MTDYTDRFVGNTLIGIALTIAIVVVGMGLLDDLAGHWIARAWTQFGVTFVVAGGLLFTQPLVSRRLHRHEVLSSPVDAAVWLGRSVGWLVGALMGAVLASQFN
ncbi:hypothetical protein SB768_29770 [Burkholderia sp. SIMBA_043]|uniref:hypothetical protein n=1 Tax=Burkholderia TaxID=32008 RepID=UPI0005D820B3|nr:MULTISPECIES: hypothetical protein [Burkholderia cepacia complex]AJY09077.1 putative membrane protein [Burkholderia vietnamiensis LMG 10929]MBR8036285.1 hypothetical protein [Burkholderia vietnamiensis]UBI28871.1 hypothetical protein LA325_26980 [Burkholderia vietnamiensis]